MAQEELSGKQHLRRWNRKAHAIGIRMYPLDLPLPDFLTRSKSVNLTGPQFKHLQNGHNNLPSDPRGLGQGMYFEGRLLLSL